MFLQNSTDIKKAILWLNISSFGWCSFAVFAILLSYFSTRLNEKKFMKWYVYPLIFLFPVFFSYMQWTGHLANNLIKQTYGWTPVWSSSIWPPLFFAYYVLFTILALTLGLIFAKKRKSNEKKRVKSIIISALVVLIIGTIAEILLPHNIIPLFLPIITVLLSAWIVYSITIQKFMTLTPAYAASDILSTMSDSLILIDREEKIIETNNAVLNLLGYVRDEIIGSRAEKLFSGLKATVKWDMLFKEESFRNEQISFRTKNGEYIPVSFSGSALMDKEENYIGIVGVARDMRELLQLQERERELAVEKARTEAFQLKALELQDAYDRLRTTQLQLIQSEKMAAVGQLAGGVAHEINNPMGVILGFVQSILKIIKNTDPLYMPLKSIEREAVRCRKIIFDLLTFSRVEKTKSEEIDINQSIDGTLSFIGARGKIKSVDIIKEYQDNLPLITANKNQLQQLIVNLCNNAMDAMPDGGILKLTTRRIKNFIELKISDTGIGMSEEIMKHIFEPFFTTKEIGSGTGLGLSLCYEIIKKHNGTIEVESVLNKGSIFTIKLPLKEGYNG